MGVLIGNSGNHPQQPVNVRVAGGVAAPSGNAGSTLANTAGTSSSSHKAKHRSHAKSSSHATKAAPQPVATKHIVAPTKKLKKAAAIASKHVTSTTGQSSIGSKCSGGAGCQNGKETGNFFGGG